MVGGATVTEVVVAPWVTARAAVPVDAANVESPE
jgi:hypothetical protein